MEDENQQHDSDKKGINKCRYCEYKWSQGHIYNNKKLYTCKTKEDLDTSRNGSEREREKHLS